MRYLFIALVVMSSLAHADGCSNESITLTVSSANLSPAEKTKYIKQCLGSVSDEYQSMRDEVNKQYCENSATNSKMTAYEKEKFLQTCFKK